MARLSTIQQALAERVRDANIDLRDARLFAEQRIRAEIERELQGKQYVLDMAIRRAVDGGVPKKQLHEVYLGTKNPNGVYAALKRVESEGERSLSVLSDEPVQRYTLSDAEPSNPTLVGKPAIKITMHGDDWDAFIAEARASKRLRNPEYADKTDAVVFWLGGEEFGHEYDHAGSAGWMIDHPVIAFHKERWGIVADAARELGVADPVAPVVPVRRSIGEAA